MREQDRGGGRKSTTFFFFFAEGGQCSSHLFSLKKLTAQDLTYTQLLPLYKIRTAIFLQTEERRFWSRGIQGTHWAPCTSLPIEHPAGNNSNVRVHEFARICVQIGGGVLLLLGLCGAYSFSFAVHACEC